MPPPAEGAFNCEVVGIPVFPIQEHNFGNIIRRSNRIISLRTTVFHRRSRSHSIKFGRDIGGWPPKSNLHLCEKETCRKKGWISTCMWYRTQSYSHCWEIRYYGFKTRSKISFVDAESSVIISNIVDQTLSSIVSDNTLQLGL